MCEDQSWMFLLIISTGLDTGAVDRMNPGLTEGMEVTSSQGRIWTRTYLGSEALPVIQLDSVVIRTAVYSRSVHAVLQ